MKQILHLLLLVFFVLFVSVAGCISDSKVEVEPITPTSSASEVPTVAVTQTESPKVTPTPTKTVTPTPIKTPTETIYYVNKDSQKVHKEGCSYVKNPSNYLQVTDPSGYDKCSRCF